MAPTQGEKNAFSVLLEQEKGESFEVVMGDISAHLQC